MTAKTYRLATTHPTRDPLTLCNGCDATTTNPNDPADCCIGRCPDVAIAECIV